MTRDASVADLAEREAGRYVAARRGSGGRGTSGGGNGGGTGAPSRWTPGRLWVLAAGLAVTWSLWSAGVGREALVNPGGWELFARFWRAAVRPDLSGDFLGRTAEGALTTVAFAVLGTALSVAIGVVGGVFTSETWWRRDRPDRASRGSGGEVKAVRPAWYVGRTLAGIPRGLHEVVWGLFLVNVLGRDPLVGVLAIAIPYGAITAKVYAEMVDEGGGGAYDALRAGGAGRLAALAYAVVPQTLPDLVSYGFYRLECSVRSAAILGMIGAGGIGLQLTLSFQSLAYSEMWTLIYALVGLSALADRWSAQVRKERSARRLRLSLAGGIALVVGSVVHLAPDLGRLFARSTRELLVDLVAACWPPSLPASGWSGLLARSVETLQMSLLAISIASVVAVSAASFAARGGTGAGRRAIAYVARQLLLVTRAIPPPVWALLVLFVLFPGPLPGAVALGIYNFGILGRLMAEVVENLDGRPRAALRDLGSREPSAFAYATLPMSFSRFVGLSLYRWEVAVRETVIVGVVGAAGLGRLLEQQRAAFDYAGMTGTAIALICLSVAVDLISARVRRSAR